MSERLLKHFDLLAQAPDGVARLRELIMTLAVQGKLVPQDPNEEPAGVLLQRIRAEKERLIAEKKIRRTKALEEIAVDEEPHALPKTWVWERLGNLGDWGAGATPSRSNPNYYGGAIPWFKSGELTADYITQAEEAVTDAALRDCSLRLNQAGDVLVAMYGATIGKTAILGLPATTNQAVCACTPFLGLQNTYLLLVMKALKPYFVSIGAGGAQPNISREKIIATVIGLPPLPEQARIVSRVEELMRLCDALEAKQQLDTTQHAQLVQTLLGTLTDSTTPDELATAWQRVASHFDLLLDRPEAVDALEQTILQLAVRGLLVPQDPTDEPASVLLQRIRAEKDRLIAEGKIKRDKALPPITDDERPFDLPHGWEWVRLNALLQKIGAGSTPLGGREVYVSSGVKFLRSQNVWNDGLRLDGVAFIKPETHARMGGTVVLPNDLLFNITGASIGRCATVPADFDEANVSQHVTIIRTVLPALNPFLHKVLVSRHVQQTVMDVQVGVSREGLSIAKLGQFLIPLPPLAEQTRIVARVEELRQLCASLRQRLTTSRTTHAHLAEALVATA